MSKIITERALRDMILNSVRKFLNEGIDYNIHNVYHVSPEVFDDFKLTDNRFPYFFFSSKPIYLPGANRTYVCDLSMHKPFVFEHAESWGYPLWLYLTDRNGMLIPEEEFTMEKYDGYLGCPYDFWKMVYYDKDEYCTDELPELVRRLNAGYDGVIMKSIIEGDRGDLVDDYIVFSPEQIRIVKRTDYPQ